MSLNSKPFKVMLCILLLWILDMQADEVSGILQTSNPRIIEHPEDLYVGRNEPATLNCKVEGEPTPVVTWYRDGQLVVTANDSPTSHRMLLPNGQLFFLRVVRSKTGDSDIGVYYCNATNPETKVSVISRNASLKIAVMRDEFRELPQNTEVGAGMDVTLGCKPPRGEPEPRVRWLRGEQVVQPSDRVTIDDQGSLIIQEAKKEDAGVYVCMAYNVGGEKESPPAQLFVREKPVVVEGPKDTVAQENSDVILQCQASGDPEPVIIWKKIEGQIPAERSQILADRSLKIHNAQVTDEGTYVCRLENSVGWQEAEARLSVHSRPSFLVTPRDKVVGAGRRVSIRCEVTGNPMPAVFWNKASSQTFMFPNQDHGRFRVTAEGSLVIENVQKEDAGEYTCQGLSMAGSAYAKARLDVKDSDTRPPPIIHQGPQNQTLPITGTALLSCLATGDPPPAIHWLKNGVNLSLRESRFNIRESGSLEISDLRRSDTGIYTCKAMSETGETAWSAALVVESTDNPSIIFHRTPEPSTFPGPPSKPTVSDVTETSVRLSWKLNINQGASPVNSYSVEYFSHDTGAGWVMASEDIKDQTYIVRNLLPNTSYLFLVRAKNSHGLSLPSPVTSPVRTKGESLPHPQPTPCTEPGVTEKLSGQVVHMLPQEVLGSTTVKLNWELRKNLLRHVAGYHLKYRVAQDLDDQSSSARQPQADYIIRTVQSPTSVTHVLSGLQKYTWYEAMILPFCGTFEGTESNTIRFRTLEDVPSAAPRNIRATVLENDTLLVNWEPPPKHFRNGVLKGYHIYLQGNESKFDRIVDVNFSIESVHVRHLVRDMPYRLQMAAYNRMGEGVKSEPIILGHSMTEVDEPLFSQQWFRITIIATVGVILWIFFCILSICVYRKRKALIKMNKKNAKCHDDSLGSCQKSGELASQIPLIAGKGNKDTSLAPSMVGQPCVATCCCENESPSDGDSKTNGSLLHGHTYQTLESVQNLDRPYHCDNCYGATSSMQCYGQTTPAVPYATATLVCGAPYHTVCGTGNIPNPQAYMIHQPNMKQGTGQLTDVKNESPSSTFGESGNRMPASVSMPMNPDPSHRPVIGSDKGCDAPHYEYVMYNNRMCNSENPDKHVVFGKNERGCDDPYSGIEPSRCFTPESVVTTDSEAQDGSQATWPTDNESISNCSSVSSCGADADSFIGEIDFASAVTKAAELSGLSVVGSTVSPLVPDNQKVRKHSRSRQRRTNRPASPYSTDSNYSMLPTQHKPYPKADRRKQIGEQQDEVQGRRPTNQPVNLQIDDIPLKKSAVPYAAANSSGRGKLSTTVNSLAHSRNPAISTQANPVTTFDMRQTNMV